MRQFSPTGDPRILVGTETADDAGVFQIDRNRALVQTVDFFTPIVDDPFVYGQIAAANSLSDVYAMGGRPLTAMNLMGMPIDLVPPDVIHQIVLGAAAKVKEAGCALVGGHSIRNPEPIFGLSVTGIVNPRRVIANSHARPGDLLVLTKPLGTGIVSTGIKRGIAPAPLAQKAVRCMGLLNSAGADLGEQGLVKAGTDVTGYGLLGHLAGICRGSGVTAIVEASKVPALGKGVWTLIANECVPGGSRENLRAAEELLQVEGASPAQQILLADAQTSGGLLVCVPPAKLDRVLAILKQHRTPSAAVIGRIVKSREPRILVRP